MIYLENVPHALGKNVCPAALGWNFLCISGTSILSNVSLLISVCNLSIDVYGVISSLAIILLLSISTFISVNTHFLYLGPPISGT